MKTNNGTAINWHYITVSVIFTAIILLLILYYPGIMDFDNNTLKLIRGFCSPFPQYIPWLMDELSRNYYCWPLITSCSVLISHKYHLETFLLVFFTQAAFVIKEMLKGLISRERPCGNAYPGYSFPSGHSVTAMCFYGILIYLVIKHTRGFWRYFLVTLFSLIIFFTCFSRLWVGVHYPTDVIAGMFIGFILVNLYIIFDKFFQK